MKAKDVTTRHAVAKRGNVAKVQHWVLLTVLTFEDGTEMVCHPSERVRTTAPRNADGTFRRVRAWIVLMWSAVTGDVVTVCETRKMARATAKLHKMLFRDGTAVVS